MSESKIKLKKILFTTEQIQVRVRELAQRISSDYAGRTLHVVCVLENGFVFGADLVRQLQLDVVTQFVRPELRARADTGNEHTEIFFGPEVDVKGKDVLLVEALIQSGITSEFLVRNFITRGAASVKLCALLDKQADRKLHLQPDYFGFLLDESFAVGYGLAAPGQLARNLPLIGVLEQ